MNLRLAQQNGQAITSNHHVHEQKKFKEQKWKEKKNKRAITFVTRILILFQPERTIEVFLNVLDALAQFGDGPGQIRETAQGHLPQPRHSALAIYKSLPTLIPDSKFPFIDPLCNQFQLKKELVQLALPN